MVTHVDIPLLHILNITNRNVNLQHVRSKEQRARSGRRHETRALRLYASTVVQSICKSENIPHGQKSNIIITRRFTFEPTSYCMDIGQGGGPYATARARGAKQRSAGRHLEAVIRPAA